MMQNGSGVQGRWKACPLPSPTMSAHLVKIISSVYVTPNVKRFVLSKPKGFSFKPGEACMVTIDRDGWRDQARPFTFTSLPTSRTLELVVKIYPRGGVTEQMALLRKGDQLLLGEVFGTITYKGNGTFFAAGAGITPFLSIFRDLKRKGRLKGDQLIYSNRMATDVIMDEELTALLGKSYLKIFTRQRVIGFRERRIDREMLIALVQNFDQHFYLCGPQEFVDDLSRMLMDLGATSDSLVFEA